MSVISLDLKKEQKLISLAKKDKKFFAPLYEHYVRHIMKYFQIRLNDKQISEELTSKVFEKALAGIDNFQWQGVSFSAWLYQIARNTLVDYYRQSEKNKKTGVLDETIKLQSPTETPEEEIQTMFEQEYLYKIIKELPQKEQEIIYMKFFDGYTNRVIANLTGLSETNVGTIIYRAIKRLRELYRSKLD